MRLVYCSQRTQSISRFLLGFSDLPLPVIAVNPYPGPGKIQTSTVIWENRVLRNHFEKKETCGKIGFDIRVLYHQTQAVSALASSPIHALLLSFKKDLLGKHRNQRWI